MNNRTFRKGIKMLDAQHLELCLVAVDHILKVEANYTHISTRRYFQTSTQDNYANVKKMLASRDRSMNFD